MRSRLGHSSRKTGKLSTPGRGLKAKAPSLRKDRTKGTLRTRKLSTGNAPWSKGNGKRRFKNFLGDWIGGVEPYEVKVSRTALNGGDEETYPQGSAPCPYPTEPGP